MNLKKYAVTSLHTNTSDAKRLKRSTEVKGKTDEKIYQLKGTRIVSKDVGNVELCITRNAYDVHTYW